MLGKGAACSMQAAREIPMIEKTNHASARAFESMNVILSKALDLVQAGDIEGIVNIQCPLPTNRMKVGKTLALVIGPESGQQSMQL